MKKIVIGLFIAIITAFTLLHFPELFISKKFEYQAFSVYSNNDLVLDEQMKSTLDSISAIIQESSLFNERQSHKVFLIRGSFYEKLVRLIGYKNMAFSFLNNQIYAAEMDLSTGRFYRNNNEYEVLDILQLVAHESVHNQVFDQYLFSVDSWINEGYAEYVSYAPIRKKEGYELSAIVKKVHQNEGKPWIKTAYDLWTPSYYMLNRAIIEYLIDIKGYEIEEIINNDQLDPELLYNEMKTYYKLN